MLLRRTLLLSLSIGLLSVLLATAVFAQTVVPVSDQEISRGDPSRPAIALVFNVGAGYEPAMGILDVLSNEQYQATFFVMGWWAEGYPDQVHEIDTHGEEIGSHGYSIFDLTQASDSDVAADLQSAEDSISSVTGRTTRPLWSPSGGYRDARVRGLAASMGYRTIMWTTDSGDWTDDATPDGVYNRIIGGAQNGAIIVLHFDSPHSADVTAQVLPGAIEELRREGYQLVTVSNLIAGS